MDINIKAVSYQPTVTPSTVGNSAGSPVTLTPAVAQAPPVSAVTPVPQASAVAQASPAPTANDVKQAVKKLNDYAQTTNRSLQFSLDQGSGVLVTKVVDTGTNKIIWQMPSEDTVRMAENLTQNANQAAISLFSLKA